MDSSQNDQAAQNAVNYFSSLTDKYVQDILTKDILELIGADNMADEDKAEIYNKMMETIHNRVMARLFDMFTEEQFEKLKQILKSNNEEGFEKLVQETGIDIPQIYSQEALLYKVEMVNLLKAGNKEE